MLANDSASPHSWTPADITTAWVHGWVLSRNAPAPVDHGTHLSVAVGLPGHVVRHVFPTLAADALRAVAGASPVAGTWLKVAAAQDAVKPLLPAEWVVHAAEYLMHRSLADMAAIPEAPSVEITREGPVVTATLRGPDGDLAARAQAAVSGTAAIFDQVVTEPQHRRKGYGSLLMSQLAKACREQGATLGVLVATEDGRHLYSALGWTVSTEVTAASFGVE
ncbi:GNAT family N-acetyltransferase [Mitsuaria sp. GD03876]|uniref:GNAT family N-acetyltransferase n=1 Tax=Mitsuaria sp. GD03876 TaxID=2975399 RepID=UPI002449FF18|nr:GNAT family N-acetyltransferase [Mitsuaria sp. GD03876]MDH0863329.1 GNAT family N-acetyltransferase [Mitsuaria sp. GD03876]